MVLLDVGEFSHFLESKVLAPPIVMIVAGCIVFLIAFLGCCGAIKESYSMLIAFAVLLLVIFIVEMAVGIAAGMAKDEFSNAMRSSLKKSLNNYTINDQDRKAWDTVQRKGITFHCQSPAAPHQGAPLGSSHQEHQGTISDVSLENITLTLVEFTTLFAVLLLVIFIVEMAVGIAAGMAKDEFSNAMRSSLKKSLNNYTINDQDRKAWDTVQRKPPASANAFCRNTLDDTVIFQDGCYQKLKNKVKDNIVLIMGVGIGVAFIELAGIVLACCLASAIKKEEELKQVTVLRVWNEIEEDNKRWREMEEERLRNQKKSST
ncbi:hypothetical protein LSTR_LSTR007162 [Laodelphax striatellus]|uniref:Tetraspanin n=1 Tax=Laodelphax striatellus TaxID=195883 RepID=A0A482WXL1_LAOST|nr:hypothetical protein LSTR_LSTR007162 [Laodelphax striatellus]